MSQPHLKPYPQYQDSGIDWLGEVPAHWEVRQIKHIGKLKGGSGFPHSEQGLDSEELPFHKVNALAQYSQKGIIESSENTISYTTAKELGAYIFPANSIVFAKVGAALLLGRIRKLGYPACIDNNMMGLVVAQNIYHVNFVQYSMSLVRFDLISNPGAVPSLNESQIGNFCLAFPDKEEQITIAEFLDRETGKIDALVAEQRRLIDLLKEKRQAVISHAVTKGLNPNAPMKDSGIEWLGEIPAHWEVRKLFHSVQVIGSGTTPKTDFLDYYENGNIPWINTGDLNDSDLFDCGKRITELALNDHSSLRLYPSGSLVIAMYGATIGKLAIMRFPATVNQACCVFSGNSKFAVKFLFYCLLGFRQQIISLASGGGQPNISQDTLRGLRIPCPKRDEQLAIVAFLDEEVLKLDELTTQVERAIELLQERRTALISAAVTGKIDVRQSAKVLAMA